MSRVSLDQQQFDEMVRLLLKNPSQLLLAPDCRQFLALDNFKRRGRQIALHESPTEGVMPGTVAHNRIQIDDESFLSKARVARLLGPIAALDFIFQAPERFKVLSIGPRTEMELYSLVGAGFHPDNITAIDLISTSPWIDAGDMHAMPYPDGTFDIVISSWVLGYSRNPQLAVDEMLRVLKPGGIVAIGASYNPNADELEYKDDTSKILGVVFRHSDQFKTLMRGRLIETYFQAQPDTERLGAVMLVGRIS